MQIDFCTIDSSAPEGFRVTGSIAFVDGKVVPLDADIARFIEEWNVVKPGDPSRLLTPEDGLEYLQAVPYNHGGMFSWAGWNYADLSETTLEASFERIRRPPSTSTVDRSLPVLFFGDFPTAGAVTIALNPSDQEYLSREGALLVGPRQRFATVDTYERGSRAELSSADCLDAISWMRAYFQRGRPVYRYFSHLDRFLDGVGYAYNEGSAAHLDLVQESTKDVWRDLPSGDRDWLLAMDLPFLAMQLNSRRLDVVFCNGRFVSDTLKTHFQVSETASGRRGKLRWWTGRIDLDGWSVPAAGWNYPLNQATGLTGEGERDFGRFIAEALSSRA